MSSQFLEHFSELEDPRIERCRKHELLDIIFLSVCAVLSGADGWESIEEFGEAKLEWLRKFVPMKHGIPSHDTIARVMSRLNPEALQRCFIGWVQAVVALHSGEIVAIDGKTLRHSFEPMFPTSADAAENLSMLRRLVLNICRRNKTWKSNPSKVRRAGWNDDVRTQLLLGAGTPDPPG